MGEDDEPLEEWAARRDKRLRPVGERKAVPLGGGRRRGAHIDPDAPRLIIEWDGHAWEPVTVVDDYAAACRILNPAPEPPHAPERPPGPPWHLEPVGTANRDQARPAGRYRRAAEGLGCHGLRTLQPAGQVSPQSVLLAGHVQG